MKTEEYKCEVEKRWGKTDAYKEYVKKTQDYSQDQWQSASEEMSTLFAKFAYHMTEGEATHSKAVQRLVEKLQQCITENYYTCTNEILAGLGQMYVLDERFKNNIDQHGSGTAEFVNEAIDFYSKDIWEKLYIKAKEQYHPEDVSPFIYAHHVVCALESASGEIFTGFCIEGCSGVMNLCAERVAGLNMYVNSGQTVVRRMIAFRDKAPFGGSSGMPCGACREFFMQLSSENRKMEIMVDYESGQTVTLEELMPDWWGEERYHTSEDV